MINQFFPCRLSPPYLDELDETDASDLENFRIPNIGYLLYLLPITNNDHPITAELMSPNRNNNQQ